MMTSPVPNLPPDFICEPDLRGGWRISRAGRYAGTVFPEVVGRPEECWYARLPGVAARRFDDLDGAVDHITSHIYEEYR